MDLSGERGNTAVRRGADEQRPHRARRGNFSGLLAATCEQAGGHENECEGGLDHDFPWSRLADQSSTRLSQASRVCGSSRISNSLVARSTFTKSLRKAYLASAAA